jgi:H+/Cl- antiporter ClcA
MRRRGIPSPSYLLNLYILKMEKHFWLRPELNISRPKTYLYAAVWIAAGIVGVAAVMYARLISAVQFHFFEYFHQYPLIASCLCPLLFVLATASVRKFAPDAKGSGIPQVLAAIEKSKNPTNSEMVWKSSLVSLRTSAIKVISSVLGIMGGASIGREGPTVQIAASGFAWIGHRIRKFAPEIDLQSFLIAGGAAGVAAAFNTPIAGIAFALEEIADGMFGPFRQLVMLAVIIAGVIAQGLSGNYLYFGHPTIVGESIFFLLLEALFIGIIAGIAGGLFAKLLAYPKITRLPEHWIARSLICGIICSAAGYFTHGATSGSGYEITKATLESTNLDSADLLFPVYKFATTAFSYLSGMAGGIFSPCLSIGAGIGLTIAKVVGLANFKTCALMGMVAFFSGAIGAPLTSVIIVTEMSDQHILAIPFMIAAYLAFSFGKRIMPVPLYHCLAKRHLDV